MKIQNRRYTSSKYKLIAWLREIIADNCTDCRTLFDVFGGTGVVAAYLSDMFGEIYINDFLYSNEIFYRAFFRRKKISAAKLVDYEHAFNATDAKSLGDNYVSANYGGKYFHTDDARLIGFIREKILNDRNDRILNSGEYDILLASLLYSLDRCANTVGHYEAYIKKNIGRASFRFELIEPTDTKARFHIFREDANKLAPDISADVAFVDPPYNSRQYSRFYHVLETIAKWDKPPLRGVALKPPEENMSDYCRNKAPKVFADLIEKLNAKYILVTYNNTYDSKSTSSKNKITLEQIKNILDGKGETKIFKKEYRRFNAGKTDRTDHREYAFLTKVQ